MTVVETTNGKIRGVVADGVASFRAVPYAAAPVGPLRFRPAAPHPGWTNVLDATEWGPMAPQVKTALDHFVGTVDSPVDEDCLTLNVWTPGCDEGRRPVLVWIHGGGFTSGTAATPWYSGTRFAANHDVVVVTLNYRIGALGFLPLAEVPGADAFATEAYAGGGNAGLTDQIAALAWVRDNIGRFGGDPANVTIFGESAGGCSVVALMVAAAAKGLFHRAIAQSASVTQLRSRAKAVDYATRFLAAAGLTPDRAGDLVNLPVEMILDAQSAVATGPAAFEAFAPSPDGVVLPGDVLARHAHGDASDIPLVIGTTRDEMHLFTALDPAIASLTRHALADRFRPLLGDGVDHAIDVYARNRPHATPGQLGSSMASDQAFRAPALALADDRFEHARAATYVYLFAWETPVFGGLFGACHGLEIPFVFDNVHQPGVTMFTGDGPERTALAAELNGRWAAFARTGTPGEGWPAYDPVERPTLVIGAPTTVQLDPHGDERRLWHPSP